MIGTQSVLEPYVQSRTLHGRLWYPSKPSSRTQRLTGFAGAPNGQLANTQQRPQSKTPLIIIYEVQYKYNLTLRFFI